MDAGELDPTNTELRSRESATDMRSVSNHHVGRTDRIRSSERRFLVPSIVRLFFKF